MESVANKPDWINNKNTANECFSKDIGIDFSATQVCSNSQGARTTFYCNYYYAT